MVKNKTRTSKGYYFVSNDIIHSSQFPKHLHSATFIGIANIHSLHVLSNAIQNNDIKEAIFLDSNPIQVVHLENTIKKICSAKNRLAFIEDFLKIKLNKKAETLLKQFKSRERLYIHGAVKESDGNYELERELWKNITFSKYLFEKEYGLKNRRLKAGFKVYLGSNVFGGFKKYTVTLFACSERDFMRPHTLAWGNGFLYDEETFTMFKKFLEKNKIKLLVKSITNKSFISLLKNMKKKSVLFWASNIFLGYFVKKYPELKRVKNNIEILKEKGNKIYLIEDARIQAL